MDAQSFYSLNCPNCGVRHAVSPNTSKITEKIHCMLCVTKLKLKGFQNRHFQRADMDRPARFRKQHSPEVYEAQIKDFSPEGVRIVCSDHIQPFEKIQIASEDFVAEGKAMWLKQKNYLLKNGYEIGIRFETFWPRRKSTVLEERF